LTTFRDYFRPVVNQAGYVLLYPGIPEQEDLLQSYPPDPYSQSATQQYPLGTKLINGIDGWWYCKNGGTELAIAVPTQSAAAHHAEADDNIAIGTLTAIGGTTLHLTSTDNLDAGIGATKDAFKDGYIHLHSTAGAGQIFKIKSNTAFDASETVVPFEIESPLTIATTTSSLAGIIQHPCKNVIVSTAVAAGIFTGITMRVVTLNYYFWAKMAGPACVAANAAIAKGTKVVIGTTAALVDPAADATTEIVIGYPLTPYTTTDDVHFMVFLNGNW